MKDAFFIDLSHPTLPVSSRFNDFVIENYDVKTLEGHDRKKQDVVKAIITEQGSVLPYPSYGSKFGLIPGKRASSNINALIKESFTETLSWLQEIEQSTDPAERIKKIESLSVEKTSDPRERKINLVVGLEDGSIIDNSFQQPV